MLFNSPEFLLLFLPTAVVAAALFGQKNFASIMILLLASAVFYADWSLRYLAMLVVLLSINYAVGQALLRAPSRLLVAAGITLNLAVLGYFKYYDFFVTQVAAVLGISLKVSAVALPLGISFFTFQKIAYLVDCYRRQVPQHSYLTFTMFVLFFPQLIAGPITHAREIMPQLLKLPSGIQVRNFSVGMTMLTIGFCKKMLLADNIGIITHSVFDGAGNTSPTLLVAWCASIGFGLQIYFDFSGYSDMAIGLARIFGITLPVNFASPYKSLSVTEFWRRWHITLSRFLRDYLYLPLGGNRHGAVRQYGNLIITMALGGLWHGAGWTFILWGVLHGICLALHKLWSRFVSFRLPRLAALAVTFIVVMALWVPFRSPSIAATLSLWKGMIGLNGFAAPDFFVKMVNADFLARYVAIDTVRLDPFAMMVWIPVGLAVVLLAPNTQTLLKHYDPVLATDTKLQPRSDFPKRLVWRPGIVSGMLMGGALAACALRFNDISQFIYFQF